MKLVIITSIWGKPFQCQWHVQ